MPFLPPNQQRQNTGTEGIPVKQYLQAATVNLCSKLEVPRFMVSMVFKNLKNSQNLKWLCDPDDAKLEVLSAVN